MKVKKFLFLLAVVGLLSAGCEYTKKEYSSLLTEEAEVVDLVFTPSRHGSGSGVGPSINMEGHLGISFVSVRVDVPEAFAIVFRCEHGKFIVQSNKHWEPQKVKQLWEELKDGQKVVVTYREIYENTYDANNKLLESHLIKYDFIDAEPK